jgi:hypothetical protein
MSNWLALVWIWIREISVVLPYYHVRVENRVCLSRGVQVTGATWWVATRIVAWVGGLVQRTEMIKHRSGTQWPDDREVGWWCVRSAPWTRRRWARVSWFGLKTRSTVSPSLDSKPVASDFSVWASKLAATVWWFWHQNLPDGLLVCDSKPNGLQFVGCAIKPTGGWRHRGTCVEI